MFAVKKTPLPVIDADYLFRRIGEGFAIPYKPARSELLDGVFFQTGLRGGLGLQCTDIVHLCNLNTAYALMPAGTKVIVKLEGNARVRLDGQLLDLDAGDGDAAQPVATVLTLARPVRFTRSSIAGTRERMVVITLPPTWMDEAGLAGRLPGRHLGQLAWAPSQRTLGAVEQLLRPGDAEDPLARLAMEGHCLDIIGDAFAQLMPHQYSQDHGLAPTHYRRICRLRRLLDSGGADHLDMHGIAQQMGCNATTLQQHFRQAFACTIFDYLRQRRLERAAAALQRDGVSVARAAEIAGYTSQANFSTAFRRHFGQPPKYFRNRL